MVQSVKLSIFCALFAPVLAPYGEAEIFPEPFAPWSSEFIFGTDQIGRDILSRMIYGARNTCLLYKSDAADE